MAERASDWNQNIIDEFRANDGTVVVRARVLEGAERDSGWAQFTAASPGFKEYETRTTRVIPVVALHRFES